MWTSNPWTSIKDKLKFRKTFFSFHQSIWIRNEIEKLSVTLTKESWKNTSELIVLMEAIMKCLCLDKHNMH